MTSKRKPSALKVCCVSLLTALTSACAYSQTEPLTGRLSVPLTTDSQTQPITTLAIDLLAPQRPYLYDPTGASINANALNPDIYSSTYSSSLVQTDTQIRDSSQAGHLSPYIAARLGLTSTTGESGGQEYPDTPHGNLRGQNSSSGDGQASASSKVGSDQAYQSSWGTASSFGSQSGDSSWGTKALQVARPRREQPQALSYNTSRVQGAMTNGVSAKGAMAGDLDSYSSTSSTGRYSSGYSANPYADRRGGRYSSSALNRGGSDATGFDSRRSFSNGDLAARVAASSGADGGMSGAVNSTDKDRSAAKALAFFPQPEAASALGASPFSSPGGDGELHFLNTDIFAATTGAGRLRRSKNGDLEGGEGSVHSTGHRSSMATSTNRYGFTAHVPTSELRSRIGEEGTLARRAHLKTGIAKPQHP